MSASESLEGQTCYQILGLSQDDHYKLGEDEFKSKVNKAYKRGALKHHPDKTGGDDKNFKWLGDAKEILTDDNHRYSYDQWLKGDRKTPFTRHEFPDIEEMMAGWWAEGDGCKAKLKNSGVVLVMGILAVLLVLWVCVLDWWEWVKALGNEVKRFGISLIPEDQWGTMGSEEEIRNQLGFFGFVGGLLAWLFSSWVLGRLLFGLVAALFSFTRLQKHTENPAVSAGERAEWGDTSAVGVAFIWFYSWDGSGLFWSVAECFMYPYLLNCALTKAIPAMEEKLEQKLEPVPTIFLAGCAFAFWYYADWWPIRFVVGLGLVGLSVLVILESKMAKHFLKRDGAEEGLDFTSTLKTCLGIAVLIYLYCFCIWGLVWSIVSAGIFVLVIQAPAILKEYKSSNETKPEAGSKPYPADK